MLSDFKVKRTFAKKHAFLGFIAAFALLLPATAAQAGRLTSSEASLLTTMNAVRTSHHLPALRVDFHLVKAARRHSADMMWRQYFAHGSVSGRVVAAGARGPLFGEDLAWSTGITANWVVGTWLASPAHRAILLRPGFRRVGIGYAFGSFIGHGGAGVVTADFAGR
jgi:uncharacterized protein YkwD